MYVSRKVIRPVSLKLFSSDEPNIELMPLPTNLCSIHEHNKEEDIGSPGSTTSKFFKPLPLAKEVSSQDTEVYDIAYQGTWILFSKTMKCFVRCTTRKDTSMPAYNNVNTP